MQLIRPSLLLNIPNFLIDVNASSWIPSSQSNVSIVLDRWSNIHSESVVCVSVTSSVGDTFLIKTVDTSGHVHTAEYLQEVATSAIISTEQRYNCRVGTFVTDNASNMLKYLRAVRAYFYLPRSNLIGVIISAPHEY